jgi:DNA-binding SARP family transcriptional activator
MRFRILGPLEVWTDGDWQPISAEKWRSLLACLLLRAGQVVPTDTLAYELWGDDPPARAKNLISIYVLRLRRLLGDADGRLLAWRAPGYVLTLADGDLDAARFDSLVADGRRALEDGDPVRAAALLGAGLGLWRGPFLGDVPPTVFIATHTERLREHRLSATELWVTALIASDRPDEAIRELRGLVAENPLREGLWLLLMRALEAAGRRAEALDVYAQAREVISDELGVDPGPDLQRLYAQLLAADAEGLGSAQESPGTIAMGTYIEPGAPASAPVVADESEQAAGTVPALRTASASGSAPQVQADLAEPSPAQLPADIGDFTGREAHVRQLCDMLTSGAASRSPGAVPVAFVAGAGGLGKTTLAVHAAHQIRDHFPDGQLYVDLLGATAQPLHPGEVLARFLRDLGVEGDRVPAGDEERAALYRTRLTGRRVLVVLDNARDTAQVRPLLPGSASCAVLVTTRNRTADLASTRFVDLNVLNDDEALALFSRILGDERAMAEPEATAQVLDACAGLPLAIRICAARLAARSHWRIATMANRLRDVRRRLDELKVGDLAVRASFQVSYDSLRPAGGTLSTVDPARVFRLLGLWQGPMIGLGAAVALTGATRDDEDSAAEALESLVDTHLLESPEPDSYRLHDLLRAYAGERALAEESGEDRAVATRRLLLWYLHTAEGAAHMVAPHRYHLPLADTAEVSPLRFDSAAEALAWYDFERANIVVATRQAAQAGLHDIAWRLPAGLFAVFSRRVNWPDVIATHRIAVDSAILAGSGPGEAWVRNNLGYALAKIRDPEATGHLERALAMRRDHSDLSGEAQTALSLAEVQFKTTGPATAIEAYQAAQVAARAAGNPSLLSVALNNLGEAYVELGRLEEAADCFRQVLDVNASLNEYMRAYALHNLGRVYAELGRPREAIGTLHEALRLHERTGDKNGEATAYRYLGRAYLAAQDPSSARESLTAALAILRQVDRVEEIKEIEAALAGLP